MIPRLLVGFALVGWTLSAFAQPTESKTPLTPAQKQKERVRIYKQREKALDLLDDGKTKEAISVLESCLKKQRELLGPKDSSIPHTLKALVEAGQKQGDLEVAVKAQRELVRFYEEANLVNGLSSALAGLAETLQARQEFAEAVEIRRRLYDQALKQHGPSHWNIAEVKHRWDDAQLLAAMTPTVREQWKESDRLLKVARAKWVDKSLPEALDHAQKAFFKIKTILPPHHPRRGDALDLLGEIQFAMKDSASAKNSFEQALENVDRAWGGDHPQKGRALLQLGIALSSLGQHADAEQRYRAALNLRKKHLGENDPVFQQAERILADALIAGKRYADAEPLLLAQLERERERNPESVAYKTCLQQVLSLYRAQKDEAGLAKFVRQESAGLKVHIVRRYHASAVPAQFALLLPLLEVRQQLIRDGLPGAHDLLAEGWKMNAEVLEEAEQFAESATAWSAAGAAMIEARGAKHWEAADLRFSKEATAAVAKLSPMQRRQWREAREAETKTLLDRPLGFGQGYAVPALCSLVHNEGGNTKNFATGTFVGAPESVTQAILKTRQDTLGPAHPLVAVSLNNLGSMYFGQGQQAPAEKHFRAALEIAENALGSEHPLHATIVANLALVYQAKGDLAGAALLAQQAANARGAALGKDHPLFALSQNNLAGLYLGMANPDQAEQCFKLASAIYEKDVAKFRLEFATMLNNQSTMHLMRRELAEAEKALMKARELLGNAPSLESATILVNLASIHSRRHQYAEAAVNLREAVAIQKSRLGAAHPDVLATLTNLAGVLRDSGSLDLAETTCRQALAIGEKSLPPNHPHLAAVWGNLGSIQQSQGKFDDAAANFQKALAMSRKNLDWIAAVQSEREQLLMIHARRHYLDALVALGARADLSAEAVYAEVFPMKGAVSARQRWTKLTRLAAKGDPAIQVSFAKLEAVSKELAVLSGKAFSAAELPSFLKQIAALDENRESLEKELAQKVAGVKAFRASRDFTPRDLQSCLPSDGVLVDFLVYQVKEKEHLVAFVVASNGVQRVDFGPLEPIVKKIDEFLTEFSLHRLRPLKDKDDPAQVLRETLWQPLAKALAGKKLVLIAPDGPLCRLPFAALPGDDKKKYLLEEIDLAVVPVAQMLPEMLAPRGKALPQIGLLALGDVNFDAPTNVAKSAIPAWKKRLDNSSEASALRLGEKNHYLELAGTLGEINIIEATFRKAIPEGKPTILSKSAATKRALLEKIGQQQFLHLATHGYFSPTRIKAIGKGQGASGMHPGLLSGLVLAGANQPQEEGTLLTALEVAELDLSSVELAVLSACQTGLGEVAGGEGVLGLQRAFQIAGARTTVTSLWSVDDKATKDLMEAFYRNYWETGLTPLESLKQAQLMMLKEGIARKAVRKDLPIESGGRTPPFYWAAFVLAGDWR